jgi:hypothetical protein
MKGGEKEHTGAIGQGGFVNVCEVCRLEAGGAASVAGVPRLLQHQPHTGPEAG